MKKILKMIGLISLFIFSIYYTENIAGYMKLKTSLMQKIIKIKKDKEIKPVSAIIDNNYIIPGINGLEIDINNSYSLMNNTYDEKLLFYKQIKPDISLEDNKDKIINRGNSSKKLISLITSNKTIIDYCLDHNIQCNYLIDNTNLISSNKIEYINNGIDNYYQIEKSLNKKNINHNLCVININEKICRLNNKYLIKPTYDLNDSNIVIYLKKVNKGDIILINNLSLTNLDLFIKEINYHGISISYLSTLISENNSDY